MRKSLKDRVKLALEADNTITAPKDKLTETKGFSTEYLGYLGLTPADLKRLEIAGHAVRGYGKKPKGNLYKGFDTTVVWVLLDTVLGVL